MSAGCPARILLVEDEEALAESIRYSLEREGLRRDVAADGERAVERFRAEASPIS